MFSNPLHYFGNKLYDLQIHFSEALKRQASFELTAQHYCFIASIMRKSVTLSDMVKLLPPIEKSLRLREKDPFKTTEFPFSVYEKGIITFLEIPFTVSLKLLINVGHFPLKTKLILK